MSEELTVREFAARERVVERTVRRWIDKGAVPVRRTPGGGIRIPEPAPAAPVTSGDNRRHPSR